MGREIKRVSLDFDWPLQKAWSGYKNPHYRKCPDCGYGLTRTGEAFERFIHLLVVAAQDSLDRPEDFEPVSTVIGMRDGKPIEAVRPTSREMPDSRGRRRMYPHPWIVEMGIVDVGTAFHELLEGLVGDSSKPDCFGYGGSTRWQVQKKILEAAGLPENWGQCPTCEGNGDDPATREAAEAWERTEPPEGEGWQLWETVSCGSPVSPVFATADELIDFMCQPETEEYSGGTGFSREGAEAFVKGPGWAPSGVSFGGRVMTGVDACAEGD